MAAPEFIWLRSEQDERRGVGLAYKPSSDWHIASLRVRVEADRIEYEGEMTVSKNADGLPAYLASLVDDWRGWEGSRQWKALENDMSISATHLGRTVELAFTVRRDWKPDAWELRVPIIVPPGETLTRFAQAVSRTIPSDPTDDAVKV